MDPVPAAMASLPTRLRFTKESRQNPQLIGFAWLQEAGHYCGMIEGPFGRRKSDGLPALSIDAEGCEEVRRVDCFTPLEVARAPREQVVLVAHVGFPRLAHLKVIARCARNRLGFKMF